MISKHSSLFEVLEIVPKFVTDLSEKHRVPPSKIPEWLSANAPSENYDEQTTRKQIATAQLSLENYSQICLDRHIVTYIHAC